MVIEEPTTDGQDHPAMPLHEGGECGFFPPREKSCQQFAIGDAGRYRPAHELAQVLQDRG
jgi:hypothetical protein